jgi:hypothetical protein
VVIDVRLPANLTLEDATPNDLDAVKPLFDSGEALVSDTQLMAKAICWDQAWTLKRDGRAVVTAGLIPVWTGRVTCWSLISKRISYREMIYFARITCNAVESAQRNGFMRIDTMVRAGYKKGEEFCERLGFVKEATLRCYGPDGCDYNTFIKPIP